MSSLFPYVGAPLEGAPFYVMLATPVAEKPCTSYAVSLAGTAQTLTMAGVRFDVETLTGCCHVDDARNVLMRNFLQSNCTDLFFIDADMGWHPNNVLKLLKCPGDIVAGVYIKKSDTEDYPCHPFQGETEPNSDGVFPMPKAATGFMRLRRNVVEALYEREKAKGRLMWLDGDGANFNTLPVARICERGFINELGLTGLSANEASQSGDYVLCLKARQLGFKVYINPDMEFWHSGEKIWHGHFGNYMRRKQGLDTDKFSDALAQIAASAPPDLAVFEQLAAQGNNYYALPGSALLACWEMARDARGPILECGAGLSTLVMGLALRARGVELYSLEDDLAWVERVRCWLERYDIRGVNIIYAPLIPVINGHWYGVTPDDLPAKFDGFLLDGPARGEHVSRDTVYGTLGNAIKDARTWIIDDVVTHSDAEIAKSYWGGKRDIRTRAELFEGRPRQYMIATLPLVMKHHDIRAGSREAAE